MFICGSGASLNDLDRRQWAVAAKHDTIGFNWFVRQRFVRCDYHLVREVASNDFDEAVWRPELEEYSMLIRASSLYRDTVFLVQSGLRAINGNRVLGYGFLPQGYRIFRWRTRVDLARPTRTLSDGLTHAHGTLEECVNFAYLLGWRRIVLLGIDLYDRRYFWLSPNDARQADSSRGATPSDLHAHAASGLINLLADWAQLFSCEGVELLVQNPRSLLAAALPLYSFDEAG